MLLQVEELNLDSCDSSQITGLTDQYTNLETLTLSNNGLTSLKGFPNLPNLRKVVDYCIVIASGVFDVLYSYEKLSDNRDMKSQIGDLLDNCWL